MRFMIVGLLLTLTAACTKGTPGFAVLDQNAIPQPKFDGATLKFYSADSDQVTFTVEGECDSRIQTLIAQPIRNNSSALPINQLTVTGANVSCATTGKFSFELKGLQALGFTAYENHTYEVQLRGQTRGGLSNASSIKISYSSPNGNAPRRTLITSGSTESSSGARRATSTHFQGQIRIDHLSLAPTGTAPDALPTATSAHFQAKIGAAASAN